VLHAIALRRGQEIGPESLPAAISGRRNGNGHSNGNGTSIVSDDELGASLTDAKRRAASDFERRYLRKVMEKAKGSVSEAARLSGLDRTNFRRLLQRHGLDPQAFKN
jgi:DNA-binding NtrC family response regulator